MLSEDCSNFVVSCLTAKILAELVSRESLFFLRPSEKANNAIAGPKKVLKQKKCRLEKRQVKEVPKTGNMEAEIAVE